MLHYMRNGNFEGLKKKGKKRKERKTLVNRSGWWRSYTSNFMFPKNAAYNPRPTKEDVVFYKY